MNLAKQTELLGDFRNDLRAIMREGGDPLLAVRQIKEKAIRRLRHTSRSKALKPYLG